MAKKKLYASSKRLDEAAASRDDFFDAVVEQVERLVVPFKDASVLSGRLSLG